MTTAVNIQNSARELITLFYSLAKSMQVYDVNNDVVQNAAKKLSLHVTELFRTLPMAEIVLYRDYIFFNKQRLRYDVEGYVSLQFLEESMKRLRIKNLTFMPGIAVLELIRFAGIFKGSKNTFLKAYALEKLKSIAIDFMTTEDDLPEFFKDSERVKKTYFKALKVTKNLIQNLWSRQPIDSKGFRRVVYALVDNLSRDEFGLVSLTAIKNFDEYTFNHSLNVGILSLAVGQRTNLSKKGLVKLGTAGLLHDIGKVDIPKELLYKPSKPTPEEWETIKLHSAYGVKQIIKTRGLDEIGVSALIGAYQHHWNYDGTGYPGEPKTGRETSLIARIIRICDAYDAMTTPRPYQPIPYLPSIAIRVLWARHGFYFDPLLLKVFIQVLGMYPTGSCLELNTGETAIVIRQNFGYLDLPIIQVILDKNKERIKGSIVDLTTRTDIKIVTPVYAQKYGINPSTYFV
ncbi:MAG TPA: HD domain-containing phosphohydrolase [bacterium]